MRTGKRRLEVRRDGVGPAVLVDIHVGRVRGHGGHHPAGAHAVRRPDTDRQKVQRISNVSTELRPTVEKPSEHIDVCGATSTVYTRRKPRDVFDPKPRRVRRAPRRR